MEFSLLESDDAVVAEVGVRLRRLRLGRNWTQADLAQEAGISRPTLQRLESGQSVQLTTLIRVLRVFGLVRGLDVLLPPQDVRPMEMLVREGRGRQRASGRRAPSRGWTWGDEE